MAWQSSAQSTGGESGSIARHSRETNRTPVIEPGSEAGEPASRGAVAAPHRGADGGGSWTFSVPGPSALAGLDATRIAASLEAGETLRRLPHSSTCEGRGGASIPVSAPLLGQTPGEVEDAFARTARNTAMKALRWSL